jgi:uncharacterized protein YcaQ
MRDGAMEISAGEARRVALAAQRFGKRPAGTPNLGHLRRLLQALGAVQIDAVNVLIRSHYLPFFARLGAYPTALLDRLIYQRRHGFEYWGHAASYLPIELHPAMRYRMARLERRSDWSAVLERIERERPGYLAAVEREVARRGPLAYTDLADRAQRERAAVRAKYADSTLLWYRFSDGKSVLEWLWATGKVAVAGRRGFERLYDLAERVIPAELLAAPTPTEEEATRELVRRAAAALGVAAVRELADYFRLPVATARARVRELVDAGELTPARVEGWTEPAFLATGAAAPPVRGRALLSPFDSLIWERKRSQRLFGFTPSFELYLPVAKRKYGYFVLGFLLDEAIVGRVDLKADRDRKALLVQGAFLEPGVSATAVAGELVEELRELAGWLRLETIEVADHGDLAPVLRAIGRQVRPV